MIGQLFYCPQCSTVFLKFPDAVSPLGKERTSIKMRDTFGYLWCRSCSGEFEDQKVTLQPILSPAHVLVSK